ncbi:TPA: hypothetical protein ACHKD1_004111 [Escherichia coli]
MSASQSAGSKPEEPLV